VLFMLIERFKPGAAPEIIPVRTSAEAAAVMAARG
jgi:hypothetical protein